MKRLEVRCQMCGVQFTVDVLDKENPRERDVHGYQPRCPNCNSSRLELLREYRIRSARPVT